MCAQFDKEYAQGKWKIFQKLTWAFNLKHDNENKESLNTKPSPLAASRLAETTEEARPRVPKKRALLIAVTYKGTKYELKGTINDVKTMKAWLIDNFEFKQENILILSENEPDKELNPTRNNIQNSMKWLVGDCQAGVGDSLVFYFSGHGLRQPDFEDDEIDGFDETICPVDYVESGMILDNEINSTIVRPLPKDVTLHAIIDACHSGTVLDLPYVYNRETKKWDDNRPPSGVNKNTSGGLAITISACRDDQMAADTDAFSKEDLKMSGALTHTLTSHVEKGHEITYGDLLDAIYKDIEEADQRGCIACRCFRSLCHERLLQKPQLSASEEFDVYQKPFVI
ncbi:metacaspase-1 isoform X3 [Manihot esculenta]|uniref:Peptidase C14 caspase domain-containing protein n=1 Tax=Manihot esculenta TaxID=3983 RepID=A0A2C9V752_MANES|nr:metacaspase-1 isoform X3 [Manihot esculenta]